MNQINSAVSNIFQELVQRRLWPVAVALVIALIAIPVLLSKPASESPGTSTPAPAAPAGGFGSLPAFNPVVTTEGSKSSEIRKSLGDFHTKDPFKVQGLGTGGGTTTSAAGDVTVSGGTGSGDASIAGGGSTTVDSGSATSDSGSLGTSGQSTGQSDTANSLTPKFYTYTVDVRFGKADNLDKKNLEPFRALPSSQDPVIVFMGVKTDGETAVFLVSTATGTSGEGDCEPDDTCTFLYMKADEQQTFEAVDANDQVVTYVLKLLKVNVEKAEAPSDGKSSSRAARRAERARRARAREGFAARIGAIGF